MNKEKKYAYIITYDNEEPYEDNYPFLFGTQALNFKFVLQTGEGMDFRLQKYGLQIMDF